VPPLKSFVDSLSSTRKALHIIETRFLAGDEVLLQFSDGSSAIYEAEELEKLRPEPKYTVPAQPPSGPAVYADVA
jgi:hypothetical protein